MNLNADEWMGFKLGNLFTMDNGQKYPSGIREPGDLPLVSTSANNNGVSDYIAPRVDHVYSNFLTVAYSGSVGATFYHENDVFVGETVLALLPTFEMTKYVGLFIATVMNFGNYRYSYGRKIKCSTYGDTTINLPICYEKDSTTPKIDNTYKYSEDGYIPDFEWMEEYIKSLKCKPLTTANKERKSSTQLNPEGWKEFRVGNIFICETTSALDINESTEGAIPYITRSVENNGLSNYLGNKEKLVKGNCITIGAEGRVAFYQASDFIPGVKIYTLRNENLNMENAMFLCSILNTSCYLYSYGRARVLEKIKNEIIKLPICYEEDNTTPKIDNTYKYSAEGYIPDFEWMENYIKSLPYGDRLSGF